MFGMPKIIYFDLNFEQRINHKMRLKCSDALKPIYSDLSFKKLFYEQTIKNFECQIDR